MFDFIGQVSYPVFVSGVFVFFIIASVFSFIVGVGLATRSEMMLRFFNFMNRGFSTRRLMKPLSVPHYIEPTLLRHRNFLGAAIILGAIISILLLKGVDAIVFTPLFSGTFPKEMVEILAENTRLFLLFGNVFCLGVGLMLLFFPQKLSSMESYTDKWYTLRKQSRPLYEQHFEVDRWVLAHPTVSGVTLSLLSLGLGISMYVRI